MAASQSIDGPRQIDWGQTAADYAEWRPDYPDEFYSRLAALGVGQPGQQILDLATGVGFLATRFAQQGAHVVGVDIAAGQIAGARRRTGLLGVSVDFRVAPAEKTQLPDAVFDVTSASQCWMYFDRQRVATEVLRLLKPTGVLLLSFYSYLPREDAIARATEELIQRHNPDWTGANWRGFTPCPSQWAPAQFLTVASFTFDADIPFTYASWRGRVRACRGVGASMTPDEVERFDAEHAQLLKHIAPEEFTIKHRVEAFLLQPDDECIADS